MRVLTTAEIRSDKPDRIAFRAIQRLPIQIVLDGVQRAYNLGAIFRLCDAMLVERLIVCGAPVDCRNRRFLQAARGAQRWVPWELAETAAVAVSALKGQGSRILVADLASGSMPPERIEPAFPLCLVVGGEIGGVSQAVLDQADAAVAVPMLGMVNSLNVATATAVVLYYLTVAARRDAARNAVATP
nr:TrmH family RNA methyltransferase [uncultured Rhodopila sp.]